VGKLGQPIDKGFVLDEPNIQVFEKKPKEVAAVCCCLQLRSHGKISSQAIANGFGVKGHFQAKFSVRSLYRVDTPFPVKN